MQTINKKANAQATIIRRLSAAIDQRNLWSSEVQSYFKAGDKEGTKKAIAHQAAAVQTVSKLNQELEELKAKSKV